jgi:hypothetical protein
MVRFTLVETGTHEPLPGEPALVADFAIAQRSRRCSGRAFGSVHSGIRAVRAAARSRGRPPGGRNASAAQDTARFAKSSRLRTVSPRDRGNAAGTPPDFPRFLSRTFQRSCFVHRWTAGRSGLSRNERARCLFTHPTNSCVSARRGRTRDFRANQRATRAIRS